MILSPSPPIPLFCTRPTPSHCIRPHPASQVTNLYSCVIQGNVIRPHLSYLHNDLVALLAQYGAKIKVFADNVKLYVKIVDSDKLHHILSGLSEQVPEVP